MYDCSLRAPSARIISQRIRATDYLSVAQIYLQSNFLLEQPLAPEDIKPRLLGHWGTCHGINFVYANTRHLPNFQFILGPGHGFPALQANLFLDNTLSAIDSRATLDQSGIQHICRNFSWPDGFPSHSSPITPGVIAEGGELGYALATAYGAALGRPHKNIVVLIGDGELETGTALASLNLVKLLGRPISSEQPSSVNSCQFSPLPPHPHGSVLPILHLNGYKISGPTIYGRKSEREIMQLVRGFGFQPFLLDLTTTEDAEELDSPEKFQDILHIIAHQQVRNPFIILKTYKGATGPTDLGDQKIADNYLSHQVPLANAKHQPAELTLLEQWLKSYNFSELFHPATGFTFTNQESAHA